MTNSDFVFNELFELGKEHYLHEKQKPVIQQKEKLDMNMYPWNNVKPVPYYENKCVKCEKDMGEFLELVESILEEKNVNNIDKINLFDIPTTNKTYHQKTCKWYEHYRYKKEKF